MGKAPQRGAGIKRWESGDEKSEIWHGGKTDREMPQA